MAKSEIMVSEEAGVRTLHFGSSWVQGAMRVARPWRLELAYTREMMLPILLRDWTDGPARVLVVGLGAGSLVKFLHHHFPRSRLTVVEIDPTVHAVAMQHFRLPPEDDTFKVVYADAADYVDKTRQRFDLILVDGFDPNARMGRLCSESFFADCARLLSADGIFCINLLARRKEYAICQSYIRSAFNDSVLILPSLDVGNSLVLAGRDMQQGHDWIDAAKKAAVPLKARTGLDLMPSLKAWQQAAL